MLAQNKDPSPEVLRKLAEVAGIRRNPYAFTSTDFEHDILGAIRAAHSVAASVNAKDLKAAKRISRLADDLGKALTKLSAEDKNQLIHFLPRAQRGHFDDYIAATHALARRAADIGDLARRSRRPGKSAAISRDVFVEILLDAVSRAGGKLTLNRRTEGGSLMEAIKLLAFFLPPGFSKHLSFATVRRAYNLWLKNQKNRPEISGF
jgi:hypothetical protein